MSTIDAEEKLAEALALHQQGQLAAAEPIYREVLASAPEHPTALSLLGTVCLQTGRDEEAADLLERAVALKPDEPGWFGNLGVVLRKLERYPEAATALQRALELKPDSAETLTNLGLVQHQLSEFVAAIESFQKAIALRPTLTGPHVNLGNTYLHLEHYQEAAECFRRVIALQPKHVIAHTNLGMALFRDKQLQAAFKFRNNSGHPHRYRRPQTLPQQPLLLNLKMTILVLGDSSLMLRVSFLSILVRFRPPPICIPPRPTVYLHSYLEQCLKWILKHLMRLRIGRRRCRAHHF